MARIDDTPLIWRLIASAVASAVLGVRVLSSERRTTQAQGIMRRSLIGDDGDDLTI